MSSVSQRDVLSQLQEMVGTGFNDECFPIFFQCIITFLIIFALAKTVNNLDVISTNDNN